MNELTKEEQAINESIRKDHEAWSLGEPEPGCPGLGIPSRPGLPLKLYKRDKPDACYESGCPLAVKGSGFALGCGDPKTSDFAVILEAIGRDEGPFRLVAPERPRGFYDTDAECNAELAIRKRDYPELPDRFHLRGVPVVGKAGALLFQWLFQPLGIKRPRLFIDNTIRCLPPKSGRSGNGSPYPTGDERKQAERCCRQYDRFHLFKPDTFVFSLHPAALSREVTPLPLVLKDVEKARDFAAQGRRVALLLGGKAIKAFARYGESVTKFRGDYCVLPANWSASYKTAFDCSAAVTGKAKKAYESLESLLGGSDVEMKRAGRKRERKAKKNVQKAE